MMMIMTMTMIIAKKTLTMNSVIVTKIQMIQIAFVIRTLMMKTVMTRKAKEDMARRVEKAERKENTLEQKRKVERAMMNTCTGFFEVKKLWIFAPSWFHISLNIHNFVFSLLHEAR